MNVHFEYEIKRSRVGKGLVYTSREAAVSIVNQILKNWETGMGTGKITIILRLVTKERETQ